MGYGFNVSNELKKPLSQQQIDHYAETGWVITDTLDASETETLRQWIDDVQTWPLVGGWLHYREMTDDGPKLCRTEYFTPFHEGLRKLLCEGSMLATASALLGEQAVLYKEKINYKLAGGAGYSPHQDAPAYRFVNVHLSCMVAIDDSTIENGCLEVVSAAHQEILPSDDDGCITAEVVSQMEWMPVELKAGQTLWFHSRTPHRSSDNLSSHDRRALYPTYNALSEGDLREKYYEQKLVEFATPQDNETKVRVSLINDFRGKPVPK